MADPMDMIEMLDDLDISDMAAKTLEENEEIIADLLATQLSYGKRSDGTDILPSYAPLTVELKKGRPGLAGITDRVTLFDTGSHYRELYADVKGEELETGSTDEKAEALDKKYSTAKGKIHKLNEESKEELMQGYLLSSWQQRVESETGLKFQ